MQVHLQKCVNMLFNIALLRWKHKEKISCDKEQAVFFIKQINYSSSVVDP